MLSIALNSSIPRRPLCKPFLYEKRVCFWFVLSSAQVAIAGISVPWMLILKPVVLYSRLPASDQHGFRMLCCVETQLTILFVFVFAWSCLVYFRREP